MRKLFLFSVLSLIFFTTRINAQDTARTLLHMPKIKTIGLYVAPEYQYGQINNEFTSMAGISGMLSLNKHFAIGGAMMQSIDRNFSPSGVTPLYLHAFYGGLKLEYTISPNALVHLSFPLVIGGGNATADSFNRGPGRILDSTGTAFRRAGFANRTNYFIIQPGIQIETNLLSFVKLYIGATYRLSLSNSNTILPTNTLQGLSSTVGLKINLFTLNIGKNNK